MSAENWPIQIARQAAETDKAKIAQFGLVPLYEELSKEDGFKDLRESFLRLGVWSLYNSEPIFKAINSEQKFSVLVGMRPTQKYHLGHLTVMKELSWLQSAAVYLFLYLQVMSLEGSLIEKNCRGAHLYFLRITRDSLDLHFPQKHSFYQIEKMEVLDYSKIESLSN